MRNINFPLTHRGSAGSAYRYQCNARIGAYIRDAREALNITQKELGLKLGGIAGASMSDWETGMGALPPSRYEQIAKALDLPVQEFGMLLLRNTNPHLFVLLFPTDPSSGPIRKELKSLPERQFITKKSQNA